MLSALVNSGRYQAVERSEEFLRKLDAEHVKQRSGAINDDQIKKLGNQFGVDFVCIADVTAALGSYQVSARIVNVETAGVVAMGDANSPLKSLDELTDASNKIVDMMFGAKKQAEQAQAGGGNAGKNAVSNVITDIPDDKKYKSVKIGSQTWFAENLNYDIAGSACYGDDPANCTKYGRMYNWEAANRACPAGWRLPTKADWETLSNYVEGNSGCSYCAGKKLKAKSGWKENGNGTDGYGFSALPGGQGQSKGRFNSVGNFGGWWSASQGKYNFDAYLWELQGVLGRADFDEHDKSYFYSVRCIKD
jgi:uncharacterized protein (TIGR02145 family)